MRGFTVPLSVALMVPLVIVLVAIAFVVLESQMRVPETRDVFVELVGFENNVADIVVYNQGTVTVTGIRVEALPSGQVVFDKPVVVEPSSSIRISLIVPNATSMLNITFFFPDNKAGYDIVVLS